MEAETRAARRMRVVWMLRVVDTMGIVIIEAVLRQPVRLAARNGRIACLRCIELIMNDEQQVVVVV